jgi:hypothetical protein
MTQTDLVESAAGWYVLARGDGDCRPSGGQCVDQPAADSAGRPGDECHPTDQTERGKVIAVDQGHPRPAFWCDRLRAPGAGGR